MKGWKILNYPLRCSLNNPANFLEQTAEQPNLQERVDGTTDWSVPATVRRLHWRKKRRACVWSVGSEHHLGQQNKSASTGRTSDCKQSRCPYTQILTREEPSTSVTFIPSASRPPRWPLILAFRIRCNPTRLMKSIPERPAWSSPNRMAFASCAR